RTVDPSSRPPSRRRPSPCAPTARDPWSPPRERGTRYPVRRQQPRRTSLSLQLFNAANLPPSHSAISSIGSAPLPPRVLSSDSTPGRGRGFGGFLSTPLR